MVRQLSNGDHLITTAPSPIPCRRCGRPMLAATVGGLDRHVDLATLNDDGELAALIDGRTTYELHGKLLARRGPEKLRLPRPQVPVLADHSCAPVPPGHIDGVWSAVAMALVTGLLGATLVSDPDGQPPF